MKRTQKMLSVVGVSSATFLAALSASADVQDSTPDDGETVVFSAALWNPAQSSDETQSVRGLRLNLPYGKNRDVRGVDLGIANHATGELRGVQLGFGSYVAGDITGVQYNYVVSLADGHVLGWQQGLFASASSLEGAQTGLVNLTEHEATGLMLGGVNVARESLEGVSLGIVNYMPRVSGLQLGLVNVASEHLYGVQIGLANYAKNGFLPFFPVINAAL